MEQSLVGWAVAAVVLKAALDKRNLTMEEITNMITHANAGKEMSGSEIEAYIANCAIEGYCNLAPNLTCEFTISGLELLLEALKDEIRTHPEQVNLLLDELQVDIHVLVTNHEHKFPPFVRT